METHMNTQIFRCGNNPANADKIQTEFFFFTSRFTNKDSIQMHVKVSLVHRSYSRIRNQM